MNHIFRIHKFDMNDHIRLDKPMEKIIHSHYIQGIRGSFWYTNLNILRCKY